MPAVINTANREDPTFEEERDIDAEGGTIVLDDDGDAFLWDSRDRKLIRVYFDGSICLTGARCGPFRLAPPGYTITFSN